MENRQLMDAAWPCAGFEAGAFAQEAGRVTPRCVRIPAPQGRCHLEVTLTAAQDVGEALLFANHRRLLWRGELRAGESRCVSAMVMTHPFLPEGGGEAVPCEAIELALCAPGSAIDSVCARPVRAPAVLLMGDSTVTDQGALAPYAPGATYCGWGQMLTPFLNEAACVGNFARSGMTAQTIRETGLYDLLCEHLRAGDLVLMQFGHNDQKRAQLLADGGYADALRAFIDELRAKGAQPVVVTPLARNSWWNEREYNDLLHAFAASAVRVAQEKGVPVIDLHRFMREVIVSQGREAVRPLFHVGDYTHTNDFGAALAAGHVAGMLGQLGLLRTCALPPWAPHGPYDVPANDQGDESLPPVGLEALYLRYETENGDAPLDRAGALELVCRTCALFAHNGPAALPDDVQPDDACADDVRCALQSRLILPGMLEDGCLHPRKAVRRQDFLAMLSRGYAMRRAPVDFAGDQAAGTETTITRREAAAVCRRAQI